MVTPPSRERGHVLLSSLFALMLLATAVTLVFSIVSTDQRQQARYRQDLELRAMNDSVIAETLAELAHRNSFKGVAQREVGAGRVQSTVVEISPSRSTIFAESHLGGGSLSTRVIFTSTLGGPVVLDWQRAPLRSDPVGEND